MAQARRRRAGVDGRASRREPVTESPSLRHASIPLAFEVLAGSRIGKVFKTLEHIYFCRIYSANAFGPFFTISLTLAIPSVSNILFQIAYPA